MKTLTLMISILGTLATVFLLLLVTSDENKLFSQKFWNIIQKRQKSLSIILCIVIAIFLTIVAIIGGYSKQDAMLISIAFGLIFLWISSATWSSPKDI